VDVDHRLHEFGLLIGILTGSLIRIFLGIWSDQYGGRIVYTLTMLAAAVATYILRLVLKGASSPLLQ
jgi:nitrate/nitrite transporter NarK